MLNSFIKYVLYPAFLFGRHQGLGYYGNGGHSLWNGYYAVSPIYNNYSYWDYGYYPEPIYVDQPVIVK